MDRVGRYTILGEVGRGGMAEILLGRAEGRSGFERLAVLKRILPELAHRPAFVAMFLDEARTLARIHHPNVVQVYELGDGDDDLWFAMEYLEGENTGGVMRRLATQDRTLPPWIAAWIVMEACLGLQAAHDLTDASGAPLGLVHRDVSLQNVFVTYQGGVKLLDFGVAYVADKTEATEAGQVKGKHAYMSPEQCLGEPLDRRSDVFAMGVVLYELLTATRLFKRATTALTFRAICDEPIAPPSTLIPSGETAFDAVCARALEKRRSDRYASADALRRDLAEAIRRVAATDATVDRADAPARLAELMRGAFEDRIAEKDAMLRRARAGDRVGAPVPADADVDVEIPTAIEKTVLTSASPIAATRAPAPSRRRAAAIAVGVGVAVTAGVVGLLRANDPSPRATASEPTTSSSPTTTTPPTTASEARDVLRRPSMSASAAPIAPVAPASGTASARPVRASPTALASAPAAASSSAPSTPSAPATIERLPL